MKSILDDNNYWNANDIYSKYSNVLRTNPSINLKTDTAKIYDKPEQLINEKAMWLSNDYKNWISKNY